MAIPVQQFIDQLSQNHRVLVIGGLAVIAHGYDRHTKDADIWLDPLSSAAEWAGVIESASSRIAGTTIHCLPGWVPIHGKALADVVEQTGMVRIHGLDRPLDIFRRPNEFDEDAFEGVASRALRINDGTLLVEPLDLIQSKFDTGRARDMKDIAHLEQIVRANYKKRLPTAPPDEARAMLERYSEWEVLQAALENPSQEIRDLAHAHLREFADAGDPFSLAILEGRKIPYDR